MKKPNQPESGVLQSLSGLTPGRVIAGLGLIGLANGEIRQGVMDAAFSKAYAGGADIVCSSNTVDDDLGTNVEATAGSWDRVWSVAGRLGEDDSFVGVDADNDGTSDSIYWSSDGTFGTSTDISSDFSSTVGAEPTSYASDLDRLLLSDAGSSDTVAEGYGASGSLTGSTSYLGMSSVGGIDHPTGDVYGSVNSGSEKVGGLITTSGGTEVFDDSSYEEHGFYYNSDANIAFFRDGSSDEIIYVDDPFGTPTFTPLGVYGTPINFQPGDSSTGNTFMFQDWNDGYKVKRCEDPTTMVTTAVDADGDGEDSTVDCDDTNAAINSSADEECDGVDNNCDGSTDGTDSIDVSTWYLDNDDDGVGGTTTQEACDQPSGYVATDGDCDDTDATKTEEADCATSSTRDPNCDLAVGDMMADEVEVEVGEVICDDPEDMSEGTSEMISGSGVYFDGENIRIAEGFGSEWEFTNADTNFRFAAAGLEVDAEDLVAPMSFGVVNLNANGATPPPSETGDECVPGSVDTEDESKILTMGYESGKYTLTGDHDLNITVSGAEWQGLEAQWSDVSSGQEGVVTAEECLDEENPDDTGGDSGDDTGPDDTGPVDTDDTAVIDDTDSEGDSAAETGWQDTGGNGEAPVCGCTYDPSTGAMIPLIVTAGFLATRRRRTTKVA